MGKIEKNGRYNIRNCQGINHTATNCEMEFPCCKCNLKHQPGQCNIQKDSPIPKDQLFCVTCNSTGHPASYMGCKKIKEHLDRLEAKKKETIEKKQNTLKSIHKFINPNNTCASVINKEQVPTIPNENNIKNPDINNKDIMLALQNMPITFQTLCTNISQNIQNLTELITKLI